MDNQAPELDGGNEDVTALNEELVDRLRILNYERDYVAKGNKPINVATFSVATNSTEQFNLFKNLVKYLLHLNDVSSDFSKYDEPMTVSTNIVKECQKLNIPCEFQPLKLKSGSGDYVLLVLNELAGKAMKRKNFNFKKPSYEKVKEVEEKGEQEQKGPHGEQDQQMIDEAEMIEEDEMDQREQIGAAVMDEEKQIIHSNINENDWKIECERVANKLKVQSKADNKEWRAHIESTRTCSDHIKKNFPNARIVLEKLTDELTTSLDKISKSEKMINSSMSDIGDQYRNQSEELQKLSAHFNNFSASMKEMNETYRLVGEKLEDIQGKINKHSVDMTDSSPVVKIKQSLKNLQVQLKSMDVRLGVLNHTVLQYKTKQRNPDRKFKNIDEEQFDDLM